MARVVLALCVGTILGFAAGWLVFEGPPGLGTSEEEVESAVARYAASDGTQVSTVACEEFVEPRGVWTCTVNGPGVVLDDPLSLASYPEAESYQARVVGDKINVRRFS